MNEDEKRGKLIRVNMGQDSAYAIIKENAEFIATNPGDYAMVCWRAKRIVEQEERLAELAREKRELNSPSTN
jgi:hypothetical protein